MRIGIIGLGAMGQAYVRHLTKYGYDIIGTDLPEKKDFILEKLRGQNLEWANNAGQTARKSEILFLLTPLNTISEVTASIQDSVRQGCIVSPGTSVMTPAVKAAEKYLPDDVSIVPWHWLFGPSVDPKGRNSAVVNHRSSPGKYAQARDFMESLQLRIIEPGSCEKADKISGEVQAKTHVALESIAAAWMHAGIYPWEDSHYAGGLDNIKAAFALRIFDSQYHVYAGLALMNPHAMKNINQYAASVKGLYSLIVQGKKEEYQHRVLAAAESVFGASHERMVFNDGDMGNIHLVTPSGIRKPNDHLSIAANIDAWHKQGISPFEYKDYFTPPFAFWLGMAQYLFNTKELLSESLDAPFAHPELRAQDLDFVLAVDKWFELVRHKDWHGYQTLFEETHDYFGDKIRNAKEATDILIRKVLK